VMGWWEPHIKPPADKRLTSSAFMAGNETMPWRCTARLQNVCSLETKAGRESSSQQASNAVCNHTHTHTHIFMYT
jgi:hypothetical protein